jgi:hypothetical protein
VKRRRVGKKEKRRVQMRSEEEKREKMKRKKKGRQGDDSIKVGEQVGEVRRGKRERDIRVVERQGEERGRVVGERLRHAKSRQKQYKGREMVVKRVREIVR